MGRYALQRETDNRFAVRLKQLRKLWARITRDISFPSESQTMQTGNNGVRCLAMLPNPHARLRLSNYPR